jgi:hypothetical protein
MEHQFFIRQQKLYRSLVAAAASEAAAAKADARQEKCTGGKSQRGLWLGDQRLRYDLDRPSFFRPPHL